MGNIKAAEEAYHIADKSLAEEYLLDNGYYITSYIYLADIYKKLAKSQEYDDLLQRVIDSTKTTLNDFPESNWQMVNQSLLYALQGDQDQALMWLQKAENFGFNSDDWLKVNPLYEPLNSSGRLQPIYEAINKKISQERAQIKQLGLLKDDITF
jgi:tetratricopeptide (TPR) repeat protein